MEDPSTSAKQSKSNVKHVILEEPIPKDVKENFIVHQQADKSSYARRRDSIKRSYCAQLCYDFERFHLLGSLLSYCKTKDSTLLFLQMLVTMALYIFLLFLITMLVDKSHLVWTTPWTVGVSIVVSLLVTLIIVIAITHMLLSREQKTSGLLARSPVRRRLSASDTEYVRYDDEDMLALDFVEKTHRCGVFDLIGILLVIFFFIVCIIAASRLWYMTATQTAWVLWTFLLTVAVDLLLLRPIAILIASTLRTTYLKSANAKRGGEAGVKSAVYGPQNELDPEISGTASKLLDRGSLRLFRGPVE